jgi:hypothetical protein
MTHPTGMEEIISLENAIRAALPRAKGKLATDAKAIMAGLPAIGTRLEALREIAGRMA